MDDNFERKNIIYISVMAFGCKIAWRIFLFQMKVAVLFAVVLLLVCLQDTSAWFGGGGSKSSGKSSERSFTDRVKDFGRNAVKGVADAGRFASGAVKGGLEMGKAYK